MYLVELKETPNSEPIMIHSPLLNDIKVESNSLKRGINAIHSFTFTIYPNNPGFGLIKPLISLIDVTDTLNNKKVFEGRVLEPIEEFSEDETFAFTYLCESQEGFLQDSIQSFKKIKGTSRLILEHIIRVHNKQVEKYKQFTVGKVDVENKLPDTFYYIDDSSTTWETIQEKLLDRDALGGEIQIRVENGVRYIDWLKRIGKKSATEIELTKNLMSMSKEINPAEVMTRIFPRGERQEATEENQNDASQPRLTIASVNNGIEYLDATQEYIDLFGIQGKAVNYDDITKADRLLSQAKKDISNPIVASGVFKIKALDLSLIGLDIETYQEGNIHHVFNPPMAVDEELRIVGVNISINAPEESDLDFGDVQMTLSKYQTQLKKDRKRLLEIKADMEKQSKEIFKVKEQVTEAEKVIEETKQEVINLGDSVASSKEEFNAAVTNINEKLDGISASITDKEVINSIMLDVEKLKRSHQEQQLINSNLILNQENQEKRIKALEERR
ncbi:phage tail spike protein [Vagococcus fluvialis]|uniref:phage tail spike protein n=1 Tax=Vagococcus fluvialis TaxID=2738 RepID=UPI0022E8DA9F|nr:phage tail spike protein [Vagococcus fluvialis]